MSTVSSNAMPLTWAAGHALPTGEQPPAIMPSGQPPVPDAYLSPSQPDGATATGPEGRARAPIPTILVVDDEASIADLLGEFLTNEGYRALVAHNGRDALLYALRERPALIFSDWMMPGMDGTQFVWELRRRPATARIPIILMSSVRPDLSRFPAVPFLPKPFELDEVLDLVIRATRPESLSTRLRGDG
ncbi:MAG TPA: response regulator [Ktedonobacterales bacterium]